MQRPVSDFPTPFPVQFRGSRLARGLLALAGWRVQFEGFPAAQGVVVVYPHTSNWDFVVMILAKWAVGVPARFWGKDTLFNIPLFGRWLRWLGGIPVIRTAPGGIVGQMADELVAHKQRQSLFWLGLAPEGTRKAIPGWRSGFYLTTVQADVPLGLVKLDYGTRTVSILDFVHLSGDAEPDMARIAGIYQGVRGLKPHQAAPVCLLPANIPRTETIVK